MTEFLPVSSTGHLILAAHLLRLRGEAVNTFTVVIQAGALCAVPGLYRSRVRSIWRGLFGRDAEGRRLLVNLSASFLPAAAIGWMLHRPIKAWLFRPWPVVAALAVGGIVMVGLDRWIRSRHRPAGQTLESLTVRDAIIIGCAQCLSLWPGSSRAMVTMVAGILVGLPASAAAEYSFLLALPTLGAATLFDAMAGGRALMEAVGLPSVVLGLVTAAVVAALAIRGFLRSLTRWGLEPFGWYRLGLAAAVWWVARS